MRARAGVASAIAALCCCAIVAGYPLLLSHSGLIVALAALGSGAVIVGAATSLAGLSIAGAAVLISEYLIALFLSGSSFDYLSAAYAVMFLLMIELIDLAGAWRSHPPSRPVIAERVAYLVTVVAVGATVAWLAAVAGTLVNSSLLLLVLGALGGFAAIALPLYFARQVLASNDQD